MIILSSYERDVSCNKIQINFFGYDYTVYRHHYIVYRHHSVHKKMSISMTCGHIIFLYILVNEYRVFNLKVDHILI
jgi:hypothetical protein